MLDIANPQDWNRYAYVRNNPLRYTDPTGHFCVPCVVVGAVVVSKAIDYGWTAYGLRGINLSTPIA